MEAHRLVSLANESRQTLQSISIVFEQYLESALALMQLYASRPARAGQNRAGPSAALLTACHACGRPTLLAHVTGDRLTLRLPYQPVSVAANGAAEAAPGGDGEMDVDASHAPVSAVGVRGA